MTTEQDLVVDTNEVQKQNEEKNVDNFASGGGGAENAVSSYKAIVNGDWDTAGLSAMSLGIDAVGVAADPLGTLASWGVGWLIEHVWFLRDAFDALMGDPDEIAGMASTWERSARRSRT
ncbi:hypothetical protein FHX42_000618 [Saccharopolyspora lacisalsi]|uniref:Uncharacterized protein n=1 Tax=Halosaccharopolyspora lacisalsi TaxID=1000566 RepID=A0A839DRE5_9PSEU|nr:hypothetical protein [Halosaccharopolyspora lacisalsi]MBA8823289.1 hypothetical protein [Halosaccharopolyspora lacisalsi]